MPAREVFKNRMNKHCSGLTQAELIPLQGKGMREQPLGDLAGPIFHESCPISWVINGNNRPQATEPSNPDSSSVVPAASSCRSQALLSAMGLLSGFFCPISSPHFFAWAEGAQQFGRRSPQSSARPPQAGIWVCKRGFFGFARAPSVTLMYKMVKYE